VLESLGLRRRPREIEQPTLSEYIASKQREAIDA
jgi:hypothetical protein